MPQRPGALRGREPAAVPQQKFREPVARPQQIGTDVISASQQIADRFLLLGGDMNRCERTRAIENRELGRIAAIRLDPIARAPRDQGRRDDVARDPVGRHRPLQLEAARAGFVATGHRTDLTLQPLDEAQNRRTIRRQGVQDRRPLPWQQHSRHRCGGVLIERDERSRLHGDRPPLYAALR